MKFLTLATIIGPLMLIGTLPGVSPAIAADSNVKMVSTHDSDADRESYRQKARSDVDDWHQKLNNFGDRTEIKSKAAGRHAKRDLDAAWARTETASRHLQTASARQWHHAQASFETASRELADKWHRNNPTEK